MSKLNIFFAGGFLGSGKTTAISAAAHILQRKGTKVAVITNDQGTEQVDGGLMRAQSLPTEEVSGGCFCCNYEDLESRILALGENEHPELIFAESVGSCVDLAATVINPLLGLHPGVYNLVFSVFADIRVLIKFLEKKSPFYDNVNYIYQKQLDEADLLVVNKTDLLEPEELETAKQRIGEAFPHKRILFQSSLSKEDINKWIEAIFKFRQDTLRPTLDLDYKIYGAGEAELAWLDEEMGIVTDDKKAVAAAQLLMNTLYAKIMDSNLVIGHLKFLLNSGTKSIKISHHDLEEADREGNLPLEETNRVILLINARVQINPKALQEIVSHSIMQTERITDCRIIEKSLSIFSPGFPKPTHRIVA